MEPATSPSTKASYERDWPLSLTVTSPIMRALQLKEMLVGTWRTPGTADTCIRDYGSSSVMRHGLDPAADTDTRGGQDGSPSLAPYGRTRMIVFPLMRSVGLKAATASSRVATLAMFVRSRPSRTRWTTSPSCA